MIQTADLHLRHDTPIARIDDYLQAQANKFCRVLEIAKKNPPLVVAGDFFNKSRPPIPLIRWVMDKLIEYDVIPIVVPGQHDLPYHSLQYLDKSGLGLLEAAGLVDIITNPRHPYHYRDITIIGCPFGTTPPIFEQVFDKNTFGTTVILVWHHLVIKKGEELWPGQETTVAGRLLREQKHFNIICTGDNHRTFLETARKRRLINPGSMMRMTIDQQDHRPCVYDVEQEKFIYLPIEPDVLDVSTATDRVQREERIVSFIERLTSEYEVGVSFERNLESFMSSNKVASRVKTIIRECVGD